MNALNARGAPAEVASIPSSGIGALPRDLETMVFGAGMSAEYRLPTLQSAFQDLRKFNWERPSIPLHCGRSLRAGNLSLWDCWNMSYSNLDLEKTFSLAWFQATVGVRSARLHHREIIDLFEPTLWHWFREVVRPKFRSASRAGLTGYAGISQRVQQWNSARLAEGRPVDYNPRRTIFVNLNWDPVFELELLRQGIGVRYRPPPTDTRTRAAADIPPGGNSPLVAIVLKPHGSLNWYYEKVGSKYKIVFRDPQSHWVDASCSGSCYLEDRKVAIVPPLPTKQPALAFPTGRGGLPTRALDSADRELFPKIWKSIHAAIQTAPKLSFLGYSFPPADMFFSLHVANAIQAKRLSGRAVFIISPKKSPSREVEFKQRVFETLMQDVETWAKTDFKWARGAEVEDWL